MNVCAEKTHVSSLTWNFCIQKNMVKSTLSKKSHFTLMRGIPVFISFTFTYVCQFFSPFPTYTRGPQELIVQKKKVFFHSCYYINIKAFTFYDILNTIYI